MCQNISSQQRDFEADRKDFQPLEDIAFDASPEKSVIVQPAAPCRSSIMQMHQVASVPGLPVKLVDEIEGGLFRMRWLTILVSRRYTRHLLPRRLTRGLCEWRSATTSSMIAKKGSSSSNHPLIASMDPPISPPAGDQVRAHGPPPLHYRLWFLVRRRPVPEARKEIVLLPQHLRSMILPWSGIQSSADLL